MYKQSLQLNVGLYRFVMRIQEPMDLPEFKGGVIRGGFGTTFKRFTCYMNHSQSAGIKASCDNCKLGEQCPYKIVFEPSPPKDAKRLRNLQDIPRPFVIRVPSDSRTRLMPGDHLEWEIVLAGNAIRFLPYFVVTFKALGESGFGLWRKGRRSKADLVEVISLQPFTGEAVRVYDGASNVFSNQEHHIVTQPKIAGVAQRIQGDAVTLSFVSITRMKYQGRFVESPEFHVLVRNLLRRLSTISYFYQGNEPDLDFIGLIELAKKVSCENLSIYWKEWRRYSGRSKTTMDFSGFMGRARYRGNLDKFLPLLLYGSLLNVGKNSTFGLGQYVVEL